MLKFSFSLLIILIVCPKSWLPKVNNLLFLEKNATFAGVVWGATMTRMIVLIH